MRVPTAIVLIETEADVEALFKRTMAQVRANLAPEQA